MLASDYLKNKLGCRDERVGRYNVLRLAHAHFNFERIFVFFSKKNKQADMDDYTYYQKEIYKGEQDLSMFM